LVKKLFLTPFLSRPLPYIASAKSVLVVDSEGGDWGDLPPVSEKKKWIFSWECLKGELSLFIYSYKIPPPPFFWGWIRPGSVSNRAEGD